MAHRQRRRGGLEMGECRYWHHAAAARGNIDVLQRAWILPEGWIDHHDYVVLIQGSVSRGYLPFAEGVVQNAIDGLRRDAEPRSGGPVDDQIGRQALVLGVAVHVR